MKKLLLAIVTLSSLPLSQSLATPLEITVIEFPPYQVVNSNSFSGTVIDRLKLFCSNLKDGCSFSATPMKRVYKDLKSGVLQSGVFLTNHLEGTDKYIYSKIPIVNLEVQIAFNNNKIQCSSTESCLSKFKNKNIGLVRGFSYNGYIKEIEKAKHQLRITTVTSNDQLLRLLNANRLDAIIDYKCRIESAISKYNFKNFTRVPLKKYSAYFILNKNLKNIDQIFSTFQSINKSPVNYIAK